MKTAPSCPLHLGILDSPDYWTDNALVDVVSPASASEWRQWIEESESDCRIGNWDSKAGSRG